MSISARFLHHQSTKMLEVLSSSKIQIIIITFIMIHKQGYINILISFVSFIIHMLFDDTCIIVLVKNNNTRERFQVVAT
jgi:hypothetical protein